MSQPQPPPTGAAPVLPFSTDNTLGALLVGGLLATALWGITSAQTYVYYQQRGSDPLKFRILVAFLWCLDTLDTILNCHILYHYLVVNFMNPLAIAAPVWSVVLHVLITSLTDFIIRSLFARRVYRLSHGNIILTAGIILISLVDLICGIIITVKAFGISTWVELNGISALFYVNFAAGFSGDFYVALALCFYLYKSRTGFLKTNGLINTLMLYSINTGLLTALDAILGFIFYIVMPNNFVFIAFYLLLSKMYLNSYLATLNAREHLKDKSDGVVSIHLSQISPGSRGYDTRGDSEPPSAVSKRSNDLTIKVETIVSSKTDSYGEYESEKKRRPKISNQDSA